MSKSLRGFAAMDPAKQREIASRGGRAAHLKGTAHEFTPEEARVAGSKGGRASRRRALSLAPNPTPIDQVQPIPVHGIDSVANENPKTDF